MSTDALYKLNALPKSTQIQKLKQALEFCDYAKERGQQAGIVDPNHPSQPQPITAENFVRKGIEDLDFDPDYFRGTGLTSPEGWAWRQKPSGK